MLVASGGTSRERGPIEWLSLNGQRLLRRVVAAKTDRGMHFNREGMSYRDGRLYLLPEDDPSWLFVFTPAGRR